MNGADITSPNVTSVINHLAGATSEAIIKILEASEDQPFSDVVKANIRQLLDVTSKFTRYIFIPSFRELLMSMNLGEHFFELFIN